MKYDVDDIIRCVAEQNGITTDEVLSEIQRVIDAVYNSDDPETRALWKSVPFADTPTPQQFLIYLIEHMRNGYLD